MKTETRWIKFAGVGALALVFVAGCAGSDQNGDGKATDSPEAANMQKVVDAAQESAKGAANSASNAISNAASNAAPAMKNADDAVTITPTVKTALGANAALKGSKIDVSTTDKNVSLDGTVKTAAQKTIAGNIAKQKAPGYQIKNNLKVG
ncbi:MAG TPA: BON domain-containing protein [Abditibacteriaceae bacterium]